MLILNAKSKLMFSSNKIPSLLEFTSYVGVKKDTYMYQTFERLYNYVFNGSFNLLDEYSVYYSKEYLKFDSFLENYYNFDMELIKTVNYELSLGNNIYFSNLSLKVDYGIDKLISTDYEDNKILTVLYKFFKEYK